MPKLAVNSNDKEDSSVEDMQILKPMMVMKTQSSIIALGTEAQKFKKKVLPSEWLLRNTWPPTKHTWDVFGDADSGAYLQSAANVDQYKTTCYYFYACLALVACEFSVDKLQAISKVTMPDFIYEKLDTDQRKCFKQFERVYNWVQNRLVERFCAYAKLWLKSKREKDYEKQEIYTT